VAIRDAARRFLCGEPGAWRDAGADEDDHTAAEFGDYSVGYAGGASARAGDCAADSGREGNRGTDYRDGPEDRARLQRQLKELEPAA
jgi:hypothetical protein